MDFNTTIVGQGRFADGVEDYFCLQGLSNKPSEKAFVYESSKKGYEVVLLKDSSQRNKWLVAAKIASFMTVLVPLIMLMIKGCMRAANHYKTVSLAHVAKGSMIITEPDLKMMENEIHDALNYYNNNLPVGEEFFNASTFYYKVYEDNTEEAIDHNIDAIGFMHMVKKIEKCANIAIPHAMKMTVNHNGRDYSVVIREAHGGVGPKTKMDAMLCSSDKAAKELSKMLIGSGGHISYNDIDFQHGIDMGGFDNKTSDQLVIRNGEQRIQDFVISDPNGSKRNKIQGTHHFLDTAPKLVQDSMLKANGIRTDAVFKPLDPKIAGILYRQLKVTSKIFRENGIRFWLSSGTYLGYVRHGGIIPWDDDIDIQIHHEDREKVLGLKDEFAKYGLLVHDKQKENFNIKICQMCDPKKEYSKCDYPAIDVFTSKQDGDSYYFGYKNARKNWPEDRWHKDNIENLREVEFGPGIIAYVPSGAGLEVNGSDDNYYLRENYGKDWYYLAYRIWNHAEHRRFKREEVYIQNHTPVDFDADVADLDNID